MSSVLDERGDDLVIRICLEGRGRWVDIDRALKDSGFSRNIEGSGWPSYPRIQRMIRENKIMRAMPNTK